MLRQLAAMLKFATQFLLMLEYPSGCCSSLSAEFPLVLNLQPPRRCVAPHACFVYDFLTARTAF